MPTPNSTDEPYCSAAEFLDRTDWRPIAELMADVPGPRNPVRSNLLDQNRTEGRRLWTLLMDASGQVEAAVGVGGAYEEMDLSALTGASAAFLKRLVRDLALWECYQRRPDLFTNIPESVKNVANLLNAISGGAMVFGLQGNMDAGRMELTINSINQPAANGTIVTAAFGYFGRRANQLPASGYPGGYPSVNE